MKDSCKVTFQPDGLSVHVFPGTPVLEAAGEAGIVVDTPCGGKGTCGKCRVQIVEGAADPSEEEKNIFTSEKLESGFRLACQTRINSDIVITIPSSSRFFEQKILTDGDGEAVLEPCLEKRCVEVTEATLEAPRSAQERICEALDSSELPYRVFADLPGILPEGMGTVTAVTDCGNVIAIEPGDTSATLLGAAFDIGTTTVVGVLVDLKTGKRLRIASRTNPQVTFGDDVVSRIEHAGTAKGLDELRDAITGCINEILIELTEETGTDAVYELTAAGNTTMSHLLLGVNPASVAVAPYAAVFRGPVRAQAAELGLSMNPRGVVHVLPNIVGFVGSDTVGVVLATGMMSGSGIRLAVDIGTNGEIVLAKDGRLVCCSTAAGPAFEGARISQGMRAMPGAIEKVIIAGDIGINTIGNAPPRGICGSGLIDAVACLLDAGIIETTGRMPGRAELPDTVDTSLLDRAIEKDGQPAFLLASGGEGGEVALTQRDVREVQLAKGAIYAGIQTLLAEENIEIDDIDEVLLAGAMANFIRRSNAKRIGLLPDIPSEKIRFVGNAALAGARMALVCSSCRDEAEKISSSVGYVELATQTNFQMLFADAMMFPDGPPQ